MNESVADPRGAQQTPPPPPPPLKIGSTMAFLSHVFIRMLKNKAQIARESIKTTLDLPGPLSGPWTPDEKKIAPPPPLNENPGSAPDELLYRSTKDKNN